MSYRVVITEQALARIDEQVAFITVDAKAPLNAARWLARVLAAAEMLESMPRRWGHRQEAGRSGIRNAVARLLLKEYASH